MKNIKRPEVFLEKSYQADSEFIFNLFKNGTVFRLTGASDIQYDFKVDGVFCLTFKDRGSIYGRFIKINTGEIILEWNVNGFQRPDEIKTLVEISLRTEKDKCILTLSHRYILNPEAASAKQRAWKGILEEMVNEVDNK